MSAPTPANPGSTPPSSAPVSLPEFSFSGYATATPAGLVPVPFWPRALARILDWIFEVFLGFVIGFTSGMILRMAAAMSGGAAAIHVQRNPFLGILFGLLASIAYHTGCEGLHGSTLGKAICGMTVVKEDGSGPCGIVAAMGRSAAFLVDGLFFGAIGALAMSSSPMYQRHGDKWFKTAVVKISSVAPDKRESSGKFFAALSLGVVANAAIMFLLLAIERM